MNKYMFWSIQTSFFKLRLPLAYLPDSIAHVVVNLPENAQKPILWEAFLQRPFNNKCQC